MLKIEPINYTFSVVITTAGRKSTNAAVASALRENCPVVLVSDGADLPSDQFPCVKWKYVTYVRLGRNFGVIDGVCHYGQTAQNVGVWMAKTKFAMLLGDDDELIPNSASFMRSKMIERPEVDIWIPGIRYNDGVTLCNQPGLTMGNVSHSVFRTTVVALEPMYDFLGDNPGTSDYHHLQRCSKRGFNIAWFEKPCVLIRPHLPGRRGYGEL